MKQTNLLTRMLLLCALVVGSTSVWATEKSYTLTFKTSGTTNDGSASWSKSSNVSDVLSDGGDYVSSISAASNIYPARDGRGAKFGGSSKAGSITFALSNDGKVKATKVVIKGGAYISKSKAEAAAVKVNNGTAVAFDQEVTSYTEEDITYNFPSATDITTLSLTQNTASNGRFYIVSVTVYYEEDDTGLETATWALNPTTATVTAGQSTTLQLTTNYDGTLNFTSNDTGVATVSYNSSTKVITINGVASGTTNISVTGAATSTYNAISKTISVTVNHAELAYNVTDVMSGFGYSYFGLTASGSYAQPDVTSTDKKDEHGVTISWARNGNSNTKPRYDESYVRFYKGNSLTITASSGSYITKVVFTEPSSGKDWNGSMSVEDGDYDNTEKTWYATETGVTSLVLTGTEGTKRIGGMEVYLYASPVPVTISPAKYATFASDYDLDFSGVAGLSAYTATVSESTVTFSKVTGSVKAGEGLLLYADVNESTPFAIPVATDSPSAVAGNKLVRGNDAAVASDNGDNTSNYILSNNGGVVNFYLAAGKTVPASKAYLKDVPKTAAKMVLPFGDEETTAIETFNVERLTFNDNAPMYNLAGQRVGESYKGIVIVNGRKVVKK